MKSVSSRIAWVDLAKLIGIVAIVYGHAVPEGVLTRYVYSFHVPLFFFLQGVVFSITKGDEKPFGSFAKRKAFALLVPYFCFAFISTGVLYVASKFVSFSDAEMFRSIPKLIVNILMGYCDANRPIWFLPSAFLLLVLAYWLVRGLRQLDSKVARLSIWAIIVVIGVATLYGIEEFTTVKFLPWKLDGVIYLFPFFILGYLLEEYGGMKKIADLPKLGSFAIAFGCIAIGAVLGVLNATANYLSNYYGNILITYLAASASCIGLCVLAMHIPPIPVLLRVGTATLSILVMHKFPILLFQNIIPYTANLLAKQSVITGLIVTIVSIGLCCVAEIVLLWLCPWILGRHRQKRLKR